MKMKLDENIGMRGKELLVAAGHDVATVLDQNLQSAPDSTVIDVCRSEQRCLVTLDLDFSNPIQFNPALYSGIAVLRLPNRST
jgi:predicted nuclease of predicted toxin-antitoxin system